jgi:predicted  nucleic acid-binding Zn ribbon protein
MDTAQIFFRARNSKNAEEVCDKVQGYLAALLHNGRIVGDHTPMAKLRGGYLVTASLPEADALSDRFADKWVRSVFENLRRLESIGRK